MAILSVLLRVLYWVQSKLLLHWAGEAAMAQRVDGWHLGDVMMTHKVFYSTAVTCTMRLSQHRCGGWP